MRTLPLLALAGAFAGVGLILYGGYLEVAAASAERACRAQADGLAELSCMNFDRIGSVFAMGWGVGGLALSGVLLLVDRLTRRDVNRRGS